MKNFTVTLFAFLITSSGMCLGFPGGLDPSFGNAGMAFFDYANSSGDRATSVAIQPDGKILAAGDIHIGFGPLLVRFRQDGSLDDSFGNGGFLSQFELALHSISAVAVQLDGKIILAGKMPNDFSSGGFVYVCRRMPNGAADLSFVGIHGCRLLKWENNTAEALLGAMALQADGRIVVVGTSVTSNPNFSNFGIARINATGTMDTTFSGDGKLVTGFPDVQGSGRSFANAVAVNLVSGKVAVAGHMVGISGDDNFAVKVLLSDGSLDTSFNQSILFPGRSTDFVGGDDRAYGVTFQGSKVIVAGVADFPNSDRDFALAKYNSNGTLDNGFGFGGRLATTFSVSVDSAAAITLQPDGKIIAAGIAVNPTFGASDFALARYGSNGVLDWGFGENGKAFSNYDSRGKGAQAIALQNDGRIVVAGLTYNADYTKYEMAVARYLP